jgi:Ca-activated chloride channel family protein
LLLIEAFLPERKDPPRKPRTRRLKTSTALAALLMGGLLPVTTHASPSSALRNYKAGQYEEALNEYEKELKKKGDDPRLHFNAGAAAYRNQQFTNAARYFHQATLSPDLNLQGSAYYNLGNTHYQLGGKSINPSEKTRHWEEALKHFDSSLKLFPRDADAKFNHDFVQRQLEELRKQEQQQQQQSGSGSQQQNPQDQNQQPQQDQQQPSGAQDPSGRQLETQQPSPSGQNNRTGDRSPQDPSRPPQQQQHRQPPSDAAAGSDRQQADVSPAAPGQMTPEQAARLLDAQKDNEQLLPATPAPRDPSRPHSRKDW